MPVGVPVMPDDDPRRTFTDYSDFPGYGPGAYSPRNPWRAPGSSPINGPCGGYGGNTKGCHHADGTPAPCVIGGEAYGPDAVDFYNKGKLGRNVQRTRWQVSPPFCGCRIPFGSPDCAARLGRRDGVHSVLEPRRRLRTS